MTNSIGMKLTLIPAGEFAMGSPENERGRDRDEEQHRVRISKPFYMGVYPVTQTEYASIIGRNRDLFFSQEGSFKVRVAGLNTSRFPVEGVSWDDAQEFCRRLSKKEGKTYRLPTEAEWEYACRAGTTSKYNLGNQISPHEANIDGLRVFNGDSKGPALGRPTTVGSYTANAFRLYDMHGDVWQWCQDWYGENYYLSSSPDDPQGPSVGSFRVIRGGSWQSDVFVCRSAFRHAVEPVYRLNYLGFRAVREQ